MHTIIPIQHIDRGDQHEHDQPITHALSQEQQREPDPASREQQQQTIVQAGTGEVVPIMVPLGDNMPKANLPVFTKVPDVPKCSHGPPSGK